MPTKIRLQRHGRKGKPFYHIVVADSRAKRDGRFIEKLGTYNPTTQPATIELNFDKAVNWLQTGAQPTDTARAILSYKGVMMKNHLLNGVRKGAFNEEQAEEKFAAWTKEKEAKIQGATDSIAKAKADEAAKRLAAEKEANEARAKEIAAKNAPEVVEEETPAAEEATEETAQTIDEAAAEAANEAPAEEATPEAEAKAEETTEEAPEAKAKEAPAEDENKDA